MNSHEQALNAAREFIEPHASFKRGYGGHLVAKNQAAIIVNMIDAALQPTEQPAIVLIRVKDQLPECIHECTTSDANVSDTVLLYGKYLDGRAAYGFGHLQDDGKWICYEGEYDQMMVSEVTHWGRLRQPTEQPEAAQRTAASFLDLRTVHEAEVSWWWKESVLHDSDYHIKVNDSMGGKVKEIERKYDVTNDTRYCCQWEGMLLYGTDRDQVAAAGRELARHLAQFKHVFPLNEASKFADGEQALQEPEAAQDERERFEKWWQAEGKYRSQPKEKCFLAWQAAKRDAAQAAAARKQGVPVMLDPGVVDSMTARLLKAEAASNTCKVDYLRANFTPFYLLANARAIVAAPWRTKENWILASRLFAVGSTTARAICKEAGIDPDGSSVAMDAAPSDSGREG